jgi:hypothetical protein
MRTANVAAMDPIAEPTLPAFMKNANTVVTRMASWATPEAWLGGNPVPPRDEINRMVFHPEIGTIEFASRIGFVAPSREMIETVQKAMATHETGRIVEVGAGQGYLSALFRLAGIETTATDLKPNEYVRYCPVKPLGASDAMRAHPDDAVLLSWPQPNPMWGMPSLVGLQVLRALKPGNLLFYIHGYDEGHLFVNEPYLLETIRQTCIQVGPKLPLPLAPRDEGNSLRIFRKLDMPQY